MTNITFIKLIQERLGVQPDGILGPLTIAALDAKLPAPTTRLIAQTADPAIDERSERNIQTLLPQVRSYARLLIVKAAEAGIQIKVTSGTRTYEEQNTLYAQGRTAPGKIVTNARAGFSAHNFSTAFDVTEFHDDQPVWESPNYEKVGHIGEELGLSWGGRWSSPDLPHFYLKPEWARNLTESQMLAKLRELHEKGQNAFA